MAMMDDEFNVTRKLANTRQQSGSVCTVLLVVESGVDFLMSTTPLLLPPTLLVGKTSIVNRSRRYHQLPIWWRSVLGVAKRSEYSACPKQINKCHRCLPRLLPSGELSVIRNGIEPEVFNREVKKALQQQAKNH